MKKLVILICLSLLLALALIPAASAFGPKWQAIVQRQTNIFMNQNGSWVPVSTIESGRQIGVYAFDANWVYNDPGQRIDRSAVGQLFLTGSSPPNSGYSTPSTALQTNIKYVYAKSGCEKWSSCWNGYFFGTAPVNTPLLIKQQSDDWFYALVNGYDSQPCWVKTNETSSTLITEPTPVPRQFQFNLGNCWKLSVVAMPLAKHIDSSRAIPVTKEMAIQAFRTVLNGIDGFLYTRTDGKFMIDITIDEFRYVGFMGGDGNIETFFPPAETAQLDSNFDRAARYVQNVIIKGGYQQITVEQLPDQVKQAWKTTPTYSISAAFLQLAAIATGGEVSLLVILNLPQLIPTPIYRIN